jgi:hypothetical protein
MKQTRQAVGAIKQSIVLRCLWFIPLVLIHLNKLSPIFSPTLALITLVEMLFCASAKWQVDKMRWHPNIVNGVVKIKISLSLLSKNAPF